LSTINYEHRKQGVNSVNRRIILALSAAAGGVLASAILPVTIAFADAPSDTGADAFTIDTYTFDPFTTTGGTETEGFGALTQGTGVPDLFQTGSLDSQSFEVYSAPAGSFGSAANDVGSSSATDLGSITASENVTKLFGITDTGFTVSSVDPADVNIAPNLPDVGTVYNVANFGDGIFNLYENVPGSDGSLADGTAADVLVTPFGDLNLYHFVSPFDLGSLDPGAAFGIAADAGSSAAAVAASDPLSFLGL
jgi:hypothetical protein